MIAGSSYKSSLKYVGNGNLCLHIHYVYYPISSNYYFLSHFSFAGFDIHESIYHHVLGEHLYTILQLQILVHYLVLLYHIYWYYHILGISTRYLYIQYDGITCIRYWYILSIISIYFDDINMYLACTYILMVLRGIGTYYHQHIL